MSFLARASSESGQAAVETLALVPLVVAAAIGLGGVGLWLRDQQVSGLAAASRAIEAVESADPAGGQASNSHDRGEPRLVLRQERGVGEVVAKSGTATELLGFSLDGGAKLRWATG